MLAIYRRMFAEKATEPLDPLIEHPISIQQPWFLNLRLMFPVWQSQRHNSNLGDLGSTVSSCLINTAVSSETVMAPHPSFLEMPFSSFYLSSLRLTQGIPRIPWLQLPPVATCSNHSQRGPSLAALIFSRVDVKSNTSPTNPKTRSTYGIPWGENWVMSCLVQFRHAQSVPKVNTGPGCMVKAGGTGHAEILLQHQKVRKDSRILGTSSSSTRPTITSTAMLEDLFWVGRCQGNKVRSIQWTLFIPFPQRNRWIHCAPRPQTKPKPWDRHIKQKHDSWRVHRKWSKQRPWKIWKSQLLFLAAGSSKDQPLEPSPEACFPKIVPMPCSNIFKQSGRGLKWFNPRFSRIWSKKHFM